MHEYEISSWTREPTMGVRKPAHRKAERKSRRDALASYSPSHVIQLVNRLVIIKDHRTGKNTEHRRLTCVHVSMSNWWQTSQSTTETTIHPGKNQTPDKHDPPIGSKYRKKKLPVTGSIWWVLFYHKREDPAQNKKGRSPFRWSNGEIVPSAFFIPKGETELRVFICPDSGFFFFCFWLKA